jgi:hypothetical protein
MLITFLDLGIGLFRMVSGLPMRTTLSLPVLIFRYRAHDAGADLFLAV